MEGIGRQTPHRLNELPAGSRQVPARPDPDHPTSTAVQEFLADSLVVMAFNQMGYHYLDEGPRTSGSPTGRAWPSPETSLTVPPA